MVESGLAGMRDELLTSGAAADLAARRTAVTAWQMQFRALLAAGPAPAAELRMLVADGFLLSAADREPSYTCDVTMKAVAEDHGTVHQLGQGIMHVTVGTRARIEGR
ncbi:hypothetical protein [Streptomyces racemochromogenes]|uniref:hypothetical protein n=1 Tax=Streptomyces racemochromogenes TaxID=67353 RepID=UPI0031EFC433